MRRREFVALLGLTAAAWPSLGRTQDKVATIGLLFTGAPSPADFLKGFRDGLREAGLIEGRHIRLEVRSADGRAALLPERAAELVRLKVDMIVPFMTPAVQAARHATSEIPIVMAAAGDPVGTGLISSLARPGGNITGVSTAVAEVAGKSVELIRELFPHARRIAVLANEADPFTVPYLAQIEQGARNLGMQMDDFRLTSGAPQDAAFQSMIAKGADALIVQGTMIRPETGGLAIKHRLPSLGSNRSWPVNGGLMSYSASLAEVYRQVAGYVDRILKGRKPADLPVSLPTKFDLVVNMKTAKALGLNIPEAFLTRADEVIE